jgi:hypothetical protein
MSVNDLLTMIHQRPFQPIRLYLTDGAVYEIRHPELIMPGLTSAVIGLPADPMQPVYSRFVTVALSHIVRMEPIAPPATTN